jgi:hypothetical protein
MAARHRRTLFAARQILGVALEPLRKSLEAAQFVRDEIVHLVGRSMYLVLEALGSALRQMQQLEKIVSGD